MVDRARPRPLPVRQTARSIAATAAGDARDEKPDDGAAAAATTAIMRNTQQNCTALRRFGPCRGVSSASHLPEGPRRGGIL